MPQPGPLSILGRSPGGACSPAGRALQGPLLQSGHSGKVPLCSDFSFPSPGTGSPGPGPSLGGGEPRARRRRLTAGRPDHRLSQRAQGQGPVFSCRPRRRGLAADESRPPSRARLAGARGRLPIYRSPLGSPQASWCDRTSGFPQSLLPDIDATLGVGTIGAPRFRRLKPTAIHRVPLRATGPLRSGFARVAGWFSVGFIPRSAGLFTVLPFGQLPASSRPPCRQGATR